MEEQKFCSKCGKLNWSRWADTCMCENPDFKYDHYVDYLKDKEESAEVIMEKSLNKFIELATQEGYSKEMIQEYIKTKTKPLQ